MTAMFVSFSLLDLEFFFFFSRCYAITIFWRALFFSLLLQALPEVAANSSSGE
jgi:hypothetical protein